MHFQILRTNTGIGETKNCLKALKYVSQQHVWDVATGSLYLSSEGNMLRIRLFTVNLILGKIAYSSVSL